MIKFIREHTQLHATSFVSSGFLKVYIDRSYSIGYCKKLYKLVQYKYVCTILHSIV